MATGYTLRPVRNGGRKPVTMVNPRPKAPRKGFVLRPVKNPPEVSVKTSWKGTGKSLSMMDLADSKKSNPKRAKKRVTAKKAAKKAGRKPRRTTKARASRSVRSGSARSRLQSRRSAGLKGSTVTVAKNPRKKPRGGKVWRKAYRTATGKLVKGSYVKKGGVKKTARKTVRKPVRRTAAGRYRVKASRGRKSYLRKYPKRTCKTTRRAATKRVARKALPSRYYKKRSGAPTSRSVWRKGHKAASGKWIPGRWVKKATKKRVARKTTRKPARKTTRKLARRTTRRYRVKATRGRKSYLRKYPKRTRRPVRRTVRKSTKLARRTTRRYRVKATRGRKSYLRKYPKRTRKTARKTGRRVWVKGFVRGGKRVKGFYRKATSKKRTGRAKLAANPRRRSTSLAKRGRKYAKKGRARRNPYKAGKIKVHSYSRAKKGDRGGRKTVHVSGSKRKQWYPHRYPKKGKESHWLKHKKTHELGLFNKNEMKLWEKWAAKHPDAGSSTALGHPMTKSDMDVWREASLAGARPKAGTWGLGMGMEANPAAMAYLPSVEQLKTVGIYTGTGFLGFAGGVAAGRALNQITAINSYLGAWTPIVGNLLAAVALWTGAEFLGDKTQNDSLKGMKSWLAAGAGVAAIVNITNQLVGGGQLPANYAAWVLPGAGSVAAVPQASVEPAAVTVAPAATAGFGGYRRGRLGQIDVYEAALDSFGSVESDLERELSRVSGMRGMGANVREAYAGMGGENQGIFDQPDVFGEYLETPMGATVEEAFAGGTGEYLETPMGMGANVREAYAGMGEYLETPMGANVSEAYAGMGEYLETPMGMGANVREAYAGMGADDTGAGQGPMLPGFRQAVQSLVRERIASGKPMDDEFYRQLGEAAANIARKRFSQQVAQTQGILPDVAMAPAKSPLLRSSAPTYQKPIGEAAHTPGSDGSIPTTGEDSDGPEFGGIFEGGSVADGDDEGIF